MLNSVGCYLAKCYDVIPEGGGGESNVVLMINEINGIVIKNGWKLFLTQDNTGFYVKVKNVKTGVIQTQACIDNEGF
jgi:hypothetical protein